MASLAFGVTKLQVSGVTIARLMNTTLNITYDNAMLRGDNLTFANDQQLFNGNIEGTFEVGEVDLTAIAGMLGAGIAGAGGSGTLTLTATQVLTTGAEIVFEQVTNGITATYTLNNCYFDTIGLTLDRENYNIPSTNFRATADKTTGQILSITQ